MTKAEVPQQKDGESSVSENEPRSVGWALTDSHCHLDDYEDLAGVLERAKAAGVVRMLAVGIGDGPATMHRALELARNHAQIFASAGIHPQEAHQADAANLRLVEELLKDERCVALGEIGLDYYHADNPSRETQQDAFVAQMGIAARAGKPILIHCRTSELATPAAKEKFGDADAWEDLLTLIAEHWTPTGLPGVMHCFSGDESQARRSLAAGFSLSFAGNLTYAKSAVIQGVARWAPRDRMLVETDAPFLTPIPLRGQRNEPAHVVHTAGFLAELRGVTLEEVARETTENFDRLFPSARV